MRKYQNISVLMSYPNFGILTACVPGWPYHLFRGIVSQYYIGSAVPNLAFITGIDACEVKIPQAKYEENERIYWLVLLQFFF